jgi:cytochrome b
MGLRNTLKTQGISVIMNVAHTARKVRVWDLPVRLFHWLLVASCGTALATGFLLGASWLSLHIWAGGVVAALIAARVVWGFTGPTYARFRNFILSPAAVIAHVRDIAAGKVHRDGGHNPLGAWMVTSFFLALAAVCVTGFVMLGGMFKQGPLKAFYSFASGRLVREPHEVLAWLMLALIAAHVAGVAFESMRSKENLARAMVTGLKDEGFIPARRTYSAKPAVAVLFVAAMGAVLAWAGISANALPGFGVKQVTADAAWQKECGDCHMAFHPTLLPAASWASIMTSLDDHFGEDASLPAETAAAIAAYLQANSAETSDALPANVFRKVSATRPLEITQTPFWLRLHDEIPESTFKAAPVNSRQNCAACHGDAAAGTFAPQAISIPKETQK